MFCCLAGHRKTSCVSTQHELHLRFYQWTIISRHLAAASAAEKEGEEVLYGIPITPIWIFLYVFIIIVSRSEFFAITLKRWARGHLDHRSLQSMSRVLFSYNLYIVDHGQFNLNFFCIWPGGSNSSSAYYVVGSKKSVKQQMAILNLHFRIKSNIHKQRMDYKRYSS